MVHYGTKRLKDGDRIIGYEKRKTRGGLAGPYIRVFSLSYSLNRCIRINTHVWGVEGRERARVTVLVV